MNEEPPGELGGSSFIYGLGEKFLLPWSGQGFFPGSNDLAYAVS
jgi:hypothetical protein